jgi:hypothetical protein
MKSILWKYLMVSKTYARPGSYKDKYNSPSILWNLLEDLQFTVYNLLEGITFYALQFTICWEI